MSLKPLIKDQTIRIDDHLQDGRVPHRWDDDRDIHIDKTTNNNKHKVRIKIPLNSDREITVTNAREEQIDDIPRKIRKEITKTLSNKKRREEFVDSVLDVVQGFGANIENREHARQIIDRISKHFGESKKLIDEYIDQKYIQIREDKYYNLFFYSLSDKDLTIGQIDKFYIWRFIHEYLCLIRHLSSQHL